MGDPGGIGPEVVLRALMSHAGGVGLAPGPRVLVIGSRSVLHATAERFAVDPFWWTVPAGSGLLGAAGAHSVVLLDDDRLRGDGCVFPREPSRAGGAASFGWVERAIDLAGRGAGDAERVDAIVTGPISKKAWSLAGRGKYPDHTTLLGTRFRSKRYGMFFWSEALCVMLATIHVPLMEVRNELTIGRVVDAIDMAAEGCRLFGVEKPRVAVAGLNPHAGEGGVLGDEEVRIIEPAIRHAREGGVDASGPYPGDTVFGRAASGRFDCVVAMYHDQGLIPVKLLSRGAAANITIGLPIVRTSPDHGTAFDIAGTGRAEDGSMRTALQAAVRAVLARRPEFRVGAEGGPGGGASPGGGVEAERGGGGAAAGGGV